MKPIFPAILTPKCPIQIMPGQCHEGDFLTILSVLSSMPYSAQHQFLPFPHKPDLAEQQHHPLPCILLQHGHMGTVWLGDNQPGHHTRPPGNSNSLFNVHRHFPAEITQACSLMEIKPNWKHNAEVLHFKTDF